MSEKDNQEFFGLKTIKLFEDGEITTIQELKTSLKGERLKVGEKGRKKADEVLRLIKTGYLAELTCTEETVQIRSAIKQLKISTNGNFPVVLPGY